MFQLSKKALLVLSLLVGVLLFVFAFWQVDWPGLYVAFLSFPKRAVLMVAFVNFLAIFIVGSYRWQIILREQGCSLGFWKVVRAKLAGFTFSYITPSMLIAGEPIRAYMLKDESDCGWGKSSASVIVDQIIYLAVLFFLAVAGFAFLAKEFALPGDVVYGFWAILILVVFVFYLFYKKTLRRNRDEHAFFTFLVYKLGLARISYIRKKLPAIEEMEAIIEDFFRKSGLVFVIVVALAFLEIFLNILAVAIACFYMGYWFGFSGPFGIFTLWALANLVPIPGSLGSSELALVFAFGLFGAGKDAGLVFSLIFRGINILFCFAGIMAFLHFAFQTASNKFSLEAPPVLMRLHRFFSNIVNRK